MRVSYQQFYRSNLANILESQSFANKAANTITSGKKITSPSDDPVAATQILLLKQQVTNSEQYLKNADTAESRLLMEDSLLGTVSDSLNRVKELQVQAANSVNGPIELKAIASEMRELLDQIANIANHQDSNGDYIFAGFQSKSQPFTKNAAGSYVYNGDDGAKFIEVADGVKVQTGDSGFDVFGNIRRGNGTYYVTESATNTGTAVLKEASVADPTAWVIDTYTIDFTVVGTTTTYTVSDSTPAVISGPNPYTPGNPINFNGISVELDGAPGNADQFQVRPSTGQTVFSAIENAISAIESKSTTATGNAKYNNQIFLSMQEIEQTMANVNGVRTQIGGRINKVEAMRVTNDDLKFQSQVNISALEDLDLVEAVTELEKRATALEAAQASFIRIQDLSIFNFLR